MFLVNLMRARPPAGFENIPDPKYLGYVAGQFGANMSKVVTASELGRHLGLSRQFVDRLADDGVIERRHDGFDQDQSRLKYIAWLRDPRRRAARAEADARIRQLKAQALELKLAQAAGELMEHAEHVAILDELCGLVRSELAGLPARLSRDLVERRRIEQAVNETLQRLSDRAAARANVAEPAALNARPSG